MNKKIINTEEDPARIDPFAPVYDFPYSARLTLNELIEAVNYLLEKDRKNNG